MTLLVAASVFIFRVAGDVSTVGLKGWIESTSVLSLAVGFGVIGLLLTVKRPSDLMGWLLLGFGTAFAAKLTAEQTAIWSHAAELTTASAGSMFINTALDPVWLALLLTVVVLFPHGRIPGTIWGRLLVVSYALLALMIPLALFASYSGPDGAVIPAPIAGFGSAVDLTFGIMVPVFLFGIAALIRLVLLAFRGSPVEKKQIWWVAFAVFVVLAFLGIELIVPGANIVAGVAAGIGVPVAFGIAIMRYRLYDIDSLIGRTVTYTIVIGVFAIGFAFIVAFPTLVLGASNSETTPSWLIAASTLAAFILFNPLRKRVQSAVDRRFNRLSYDPLLVREDLRSQVRDTVDTNALAAAWLRSAITSLQPSSAAVWTKEAT